MKKYITEIDKNGTVAVDDTILVKDFECTAGSKILSGFVPLFDAEVVTRIKNAGYKISGKTNVGEFGLDILGETSFYAENDKVLSSAAAEVVKANEVKAALCVDLNGYPRRAAAVSGLTFVKPTYGTVSRYGVIPCACSAEQVGVMSKNAKDAMEILGVIAGHDDKDGTSLSDTSYDYNADCDLSKMRVCIVKELLDNLSSDVAEKIEKTKATLESAGATIETVSVTEVKFAQTAWQILLSAETCNNISRYDGVKFGYRTPEYNDIDELYVKTRTEGFGLLTKKTLIYGSEVLSKGRYDVCYDKALRIRRVVMDKMKALFGEYDLMLIPACSTFEYESYPAENAFEKVFEESIFTAVPSVTGMPAVVSDGVQFVSDHFAENKLFSVASKLDSMGE